MLVRLPGGSPSCYSLPGRADETCKSKCGPAVGSLTLQQVRPCVCADGADPGTSGLITCSHGFVLTKDISSPSVVLARVSPRGAE